MPRNRPLAPSLSPDNGRLKSDDAFRWRLGFKILIFASPWFQLSINCERFIKIIFIKKENQEKNPNQGSPNQGQDLELLEIGCLAAKISLWDRIRPITTDHDRSTDRQKVAASIDQDGLCADRSSIDGRSIEVDDQREREREREPSFSLYLPFSEELSSQALSPTTSTSSGFSAKVWAWIRGFSWYSSDYTPLTNLPFMANCFSICGRSRDWSRKQRGRHATSGWRGYPERSILNSSDFLSGRRREFFVNGSPARTEFLSGRRRES